VSTPARRIEHGQVHLRRLESELLDLAPGEREYLALLLLDSLGLVRENAAAEAHERWLAHQRGEMGALSEEDSIADLEGRLQRVDVEQAWAAEAHDRWEAYLRGEEEMIPFEEVMAEIRGRPGR
jgi:arginine/lysine/ornithine decarboxylase